MFYFYLIVGILCFLTILGGLVYYQFYRKNKRKNPYHYFVIVKNGENIIEWLILTLNYRSFFKGKEKIISVFDLGSTDDTLGILERFTCHKVKIDYLYPKESNKINQLGDLIKESIRRNERAVIIYINTQDNSPVIKSLQEEVLNQGGTS